MSKHEAFGNCTSETEITQFGTHLVGVSQSPTLKTMLLLTKSMVSRFIRGQKHIAEGCDVHSYVCLTFLNNPFALMINDVPPPPTQNLPGGFTIRVTCLVNVLNTPAVHSAAVPGCRSNA